MADIPDVTLDSFPKTVLEAQGYTLIYYYAIWCKACQEMQPIVEAVSTEVADKMAVVQVNTDKEAEIITQQKIRTLPSFQVVKDGQPVDLIRGTLSKLDLMEKLSAVVTGDEEKEGSKGAEAPTEESG